MFKIEDVNCIHFISTGHNDYRLLRHFFFLILDVFGGRSKEENGEYRCVEQKKK